MCEIAPANWNDSPLLRLALEKLSRFELCFGLGPRETITVYLDAGCDSPKTRSLLAEMGCCGVISKRGFPLQAGARWVVERTVSWHTHGFKKLPICAETRTRVINALTS